MTYIYLNYGEMKIVVGTLKSYADSAMKAGGSVRQTNDVYNSPVDVSSIANWGEIVEALTDKANEIEGRIDLAKAQNENGITTSGPDDTIAYYIPDGMPDTIDNAKMAHEGILAGKEFREAVSTNQTSGGVEKTAAAIKLLEKHQDNPAFAAAMIEEYGLENFLRAPLTVQKMFSSATYKDSIRTPDAVTTFGRLLASASTTWEMRGGKGREIVDIINKSEKNFGLSTCLNAMLKADGANYDGAFLLQLGREAERIPWNASWDTRHARGTVLKAGSFLDYPGYGLISADPLVGVLHAMKTNPEAAAEFLSPHADQSDAKRIEQIMSRHPFSDTGWTESWTRISSKLSDFSRVSLQDGETPSPLLKRAALINSLSVSEIGESGAKLSEPARDDLANSLKNYAWSIDNAATRQDQGDLLMKTPDASQEWLKGLPPQPIFSTPGLSNVLGQISTNGDRFDSVVAEVALLEQARMRWAGNTQPEGEDLQAHGYSAIKSNSMTAGFLLGAMNSEKESDAAAVDERNRIIIDTLLAGSVFFKGADGVKGFWGNAQSFAEGRLKEGAETLVKNEFTGNLATQMEESLRSSRQWDKKVMESTILQLITWAPECSDVANKVIPGVVKDGELDPELLTKENVEKLYDAFYGQPTSGVPGDVYGALSDADQDFQTGYRRAHGEE